MNHRKKYYTNKDLAKLFDMPEETLRQYHSRKKINTNSLKSICQFYMGLEIQKMLNQKTAT